jgi:TolB-like protein/Flp pilus assembly protein TadD
LIWRKAAAGKEATSAAPGAPADSGPQSGTSDVFISYASQDAAVADAVVQSLEHAGLKCWIAPRDVVPGALYADEIVRAINESKVIVLVLSEQAIASPHVGKEIERASSKHRRIVALRTDSAALTRAFEYFLSESQWIDVGSAGIEAAGAKLVDAVRRHLAPGSDVEPAVVSDRRTLDRKSATPQPRWILIASVAVLAMALTYLVVERFWLSKHATSERPIAAATSALAPAAPAISEKSIAVLPFVDMSEKKDQEYFSEGLSEELIDLLAHSPDLKVIARTSSFQFKGKNEDMRSIGQRLGVTNLLEGSVRTSGKTVRVTGQLIKVSDGSHRWSQTYDQDMRDIFKVQDAIAAAVVTALKATMATGMQSPEATAANTEAYKAVLRGRYFRQKETKEDSERSLAAFQEALRLDPNYAIAFAELGRTYNGRGIKGWMPQKEAYTKAHEAVVQALKIDPQLPLAHRVLAAIEYNFTRNFALSRAEEKRAYELDPSNPAVAQVAGIDAIVAGQPNEAVRLFQQIADSDPLDARARASVGWALFWAGRLPDAESAVRTVLELNPSFAGAHCDLGEVLLAERRPDAALAIAREETDEASRSICLADALWVLGQHSAADASLRDAQTKYGGTRAYSIAESYAQRDEKDEAFKWLDRAYEDGEARVTLIRGDPFLRGLRGDPRFTVLLGKMKLR